MITNKKKSRTNNKAQGLITKLQIINLKIKVKELKRHQMFYEGSKIPRV